MLKEPREGSSYQDRFLLHKQTKPALPTHTYPKTPSNKQTKKYPKRKAKVAGTRTCKLGLEPTN